MYGWWSDVITESHIGDHTIGVKLHLNMVIMFIVQKQCFSAGSGAFSNMHYILWKQLVQHGHLLGLKLFDPWQLPLINTLILLCSGAAATWAHHAKP